MIGDGCVLLVAAPGDAEAGLVRDALSDHPGSVFWVDTADFPERLEMIATLGRQHPGWLHVNDHVVDLGRISAVYRRSPGVFGVDDDMSAPERRFALMEAVQGMGGILADLRCPWVNHPARVADASYKPRQLRTAWDVGLHVPATLITNVGAAARNFIASIDGRVIYKPMSPGVLSEDGRVKVVNASLVTSDLIDDVSVKKTAHTFQQFIEKRYDARVTVIGSRCFGVAVHANNEASRIDWRADYDALSYEEIDVPEVVRGRVMDYLLKFGLNFAAFDFSVDQGGVWWFLEANPNGLWAWLEERVGIPVANAVADFLMSRGSS